MKHRLVQLISLLLSLCLTGGMLSCFAHRVYGQVEEETEESEKTSLFRGLDPDEMYIGGFVGPQATYYWNDKLIYEGLKDDSVFKLIKEAGFNYIIEFSNAYSGSTRANAKKCLQYAAENDLMYFLPAYDVMKIDGQVLAGDYAITSKLREMYSYKSFGGFYLRDEPTSDMFPFIQKCLDKLNTAEGKMGNVTLSYYLNLLPPVSATHLSNNTDKSMTWEKYVRGLSRAGAEYLCFDLYPLTGNTGSVTSNWFETLGTINRIAKEEGKPWIGYVQVGGGELSYVSNHYRIPTEGETRWDVYTMLAFGAKGLNYYLLVTPPFFTPRAKEWEMDNHSIINSYGKKTKYWYYAKEINTQVKAMDHILLNAEHKGVILSGQTPCAYDGADKLTEYSGLKKVTGNALVGCFAYKGQAAYLVVNNKITGKSNIKLQFDNDYQYCVIQGGVETSAEGSALEFLLDTGDCVMVLVEGYNVSFNLNDPEKPNSYLDSKNVIGGRYGELPIPQRRNCAFVGWYKDPACTVGPVRADDSVAGSHTLYARWRYFDGPVVLFCENNNAVLTKRVTENKAYWICKTTGPMADADSPIQRVSIAWEDKTAQRISFAFQYGSVEDAPCNIAYPAVSLAGINQSRSEVEVHYQTMDMEGNTPDCFAYGEWYQVTAQIADVEMLAFCIDTYDIEAAEEICFSAIQLESQQIPAVEDVFEEEPDYTATFMIIGIAAAFLGGASAVTVLLVRKRKNKQ